MTDGQLAAITSDTEMVHSIANHQYIFSYHAEKLLKCQNISDTQKEAQGTDADQSTTSLLRRPENQTVMKFTYTGSFLKFIQIHNKKKSLSFFKEFKNIVILLRQN